jgi:hypothetical protein
MTGPGNQVRARVLTKARSLHEKKQPSVAPLLPMLVLFFLLEGGVSHS